MIFGIYSACPMIARSRSRILPSWNGLFVPRSRFAIRSDQRNVPLSCRYSEPPIGIEPMTYALREARSPASHALAAPISRVIALIALAALELSGDAVHEPVHAPRLHPRAVCDIARLSERFDSFTLPVVYKSPVCRDATSSVRMKIAFRQVKACPAGGLQYGKLAWSAGDSRDRRTPFELPRGHSRRNTRLDNPS